MVSSVSAIRGTCPGFRRSLSSRSLSITWIDWNPKAAVIGSGGTVAFQKVGFQVGHVTNLVCGPKRESSKVEGGVFIQ